MAVYGSLTRARVRAREKKVLVVRTDLGMTKGKMAAQCGHATLMCYKAALRHAPNLVRRWETRGQTKVAVQVGGGEDELLVLQAHAMSLGVVAKIVHDAGRTQIAAGSATALGLGPGAFLSLPSPPLHFPCQTREREKG